MSDTRKNICVYSYIHIYTCVCKDICARIYVYIIKHTNKIIHVFWSYLPVCVYVWVCVYVFLCVFAQP